MLIFQYEYRSMMFKAQWARSQSKQIIDTIVVMLLAERMQLKCHYTTGRSNLSHSNPTNYSLAFSDGIDIENPFV